MFSILLIGFAVSFAGQSVFKTVDRKSSLTITAGISIPVVCYASKNLNNEEAGFAKIGLHISLIFELNLIKNAGIASKLFYSFNKVDKKIDPENAISILSNYKYYGFLIGPYFSQKLGRTDLDLKFLPGIIHVNSPTLSNGRNPVISESGAFAFAWSAGAGMRYNLESRNSFILLNGDFISSKPQLKVPSLGNKIEQHIAVININTGVGFRF